MRVSSLRLSRLGEPVGFHVEPDKSRFRPGSTLYFASEGSSLNPYRDEAVYELEQASGGVLMPVEEASASGTAMEFYWHRAEWEENRIYQAALLDAPDVWTWDTLLAPVLKSYPVDVDQLAPTTEAARLTLWLQGVSDFDASPDHHVRVYVNGSLVAEEWWDGSKPLKMTAELAPGLLVEGANELSIENVGDTEAAYSFVLLDTVMR